MTKPISFEMDCPFDVLCKLFESNTVSTGMTREVPGGAVIEYRVTQPVERRDLLHAAEPFVHIAVRVGGDLVVAVLPESGVKIAISDLERLQPVSFAQDAVGQIL